jgi:hypothetical protein
VRSARTGPDWMSSARHHSQKGRSPDGGTGPLRVPMGGTMMGEGKPHQIVMFRTLAAVEIIKNRQFSKLFDAGVNGARTDRVTFRQHLSFLIRTI